MEREKLTETRNKGIECLKSKQGLNNKKKPSLLQALFLEFNRPTIKHDVNELSHKVVCELFKVRFDKNLFELILMRLLRINKSNSNFTIVDSLVHKYVRY